MNRLLMIWQDRWFQWYYSRSPHSHINAGKPDTCNRFAKCRLCWSDGQLAVVSAALSLRKLTPTRTISSSRAAYSATSINIQYVSSWFVRDYFSPSTQPDENRHIYLVATSLTKLYRRYIQQAFIPRVNRQEWGSKRFLRRLLFHTTHCIY